MKCRTLGASSLTCCAEFVSFSLITLPQTVRLYYVSLRSQASTPCFPFLRCEAMATVTIWPLHVHYSITLWAYLSQMHRPIALHCVHVITLWVYLSESLVKDSYKRLSSTEKPRPSHVITHYCYIRVIVLWPARKTYSTAARFKARIWVRMSGLGLGLI